MWSHTIKSPAPKSTKPPAERPARAKNDPKKKANEETAPEEDMTQGFNADGFSKISKVHASKKPLTVAKAPSFSRTTSRVGQTTASGTEPSPTDSEKKNVQPDKPAQASKTGTPARVPQSTSKISRTGTPLKTKAPVTSLKHAVSGRRSTNTSTLKLAQSPGSENAVSDLDPHKPDGSGEIPANEILSQDDNDVSDVSRAKYLQDHERVEGSTPTIALKDEDIQAKIQDSQTTKHAEYQELQAQIKGTQSMNDHENKETKIIFLARIAALESEADEARKKFFDLEAVHHKTQEEHNQVLTLRDEEIQRLSETARGQRVEQEAKESGFIPKSEFQGLHIKHKRESDEAALAASAKLEATQAEHERLLQCREQKIKEKSDLVLELQGKVEKAHQADKNELKEAKKRHDQELQDIVEQHEQELRDATTKHERASRDEALQYDQKLREAITRCEELEEKVPHLEQELQDAAAKHAHEMDDAKEDRQTILRNTTQRHDQESRDTASKHQHEVEDLMLTHQEEIRTARTKNEQASEDSATRHQQEIEVLVAKHKEELETAAARQKQALGDAAVKYQQESQSLEAKHVEELRIANKRDDQESGTLVAKHQREIQDMTAKHQEELGEIVTTNQKILDNAAIESQQAIQGIIAKHREELASADSRIKDLEDVVQRHQQELNDEATCHGQEIEREADKHRQEVRGVTNQYGLELQKAKDKVKELEDGSLRKDEILREAVQKHEEEIARLHSQVETAAKVVASLETTLRELSLQKEDSLREAALKHEHELQTATLKYEEELQSLRTIYASAVEEITALRRALEDVEQKRCDDVEEEVQSLRTIYATAVEEITSLRRKVESVDQKRSEAVDEATSLRASLDDLDLKRSEAVRQLASLQGIMKIEELDQSEAAVEIALLRDKLELADRRFEQDQQAVSDLQRQIQGLQTQIIELSTDTNLDQTEAAVDTALLKDKLELANLEIHLHKGTISALQNELERLQTQLADSSSDTSLDRNEAIVDVAMLKDKLELANVQIRQAKGTVSNLQEEIEGLRAQITDSTVNMDLDQNEAAVEVALLKNTLELTNLESHQDKATITNLQKQIEGLQAQAMNAPKTESYTHHQLREELSMLGRHQAAQMADLESLKADMAAESEFREQGWNMRANVWDRFASELQGMKTQLVGTVAGGSRAGSIE